MSLPRPDLHRSAIYGLTWICSTPLNTHIRHCGASIVNITSSCLPDVINLPMIAYLCGISPGQLTAPDYNGAFVLRVDFTDQRRRQNHNPFQADSSMSTSISLGTAYNQYCRPVGQVQVSIVNVPPPPNRKQN